MDIKSGGVSLHVRQAPEVKLALVVVSFKASGNAEVLNNLACAVNYSFDQVDETALLYALFLNARDKVYRNFSEESKSKITNIGCALQGSEFSIYGYCDSSLTCIRKFLGGVFYGLSPSKCRAAYKSVVRAIGASASDEAFDHACNALKSGLDNIKVFVGGKAFGKASTDKVKVEEMLKIATKKLDPEIPKAKGKERSAKANDTMPSFADSHFASKKGSPSATTAAFMYLSGNIPTLQVVDSKIVVQKQLETQVGKLDSKKDLVQKQLDKVEGLPEPSHSLAFISGSNRLFGASELVEIADEKFSAAGIAGAATKLF